MTDLPKSERWLAWKVPTICEGEDTLRLLTPRGDPMEHEDSMDLLFETEQEAFDALEFYDAEDEARDEGWVLCEMTLTPTRKAP